MGNGDKLPKGEAIVFQRVLRRFEADITCLHGMLAPNCQDCRRPNWFDSIVRTEADGPPRTVGDVVREYVDVRRVIPSVQVIERYFEGKVERQRRTMYTTYAALAGLAVIGGFLVFEGGKVALQLWKKMGAEGQQPEKGKAIKKR